MLQDSGIQKSIGNYIRGRSVGPSFSLQRGPDRAAAPTRRLLPLSKDSREFSLLGDLRAQHVGLIWLIWIVDP